MKLMALRYAGNCATCGVRIEQRTTAWYDRDAKNVTCTACRPTDDQPTLNDAAAGQQVHAPPPVRPARTDLDKGTELEQKVADAFAAHGYRVETNVIREGSDGSQHEIDVLARKTDELLTMSVAIECKAWASAIERDVITKFDYARRQLGLGQGVVVALNGARSGAIAAARQLGIDIWGPDEIQTIFGKTAMAGLQNRPMVEEVGFERLATTEAALELIRGEAKGRFGLGKEDIVWSANAWIPVSVVQLTLMRTNVIGRAVRSRQMWTVYDLVGGTFVTALDSAPERTPVPLDGGRIEPLHKVVAPARALDKVIAAHRKAKSDEAVKRQRNRLGALGVPDRHTATTGTSTPFLYPVLLALAQRGNTERIIAVDAFRSRVDADLGVELTKNIAVVRASLSTAT